MKVAFFDDRFHEVYGAQKNVLLLAEQAAASGHDVCFLTTYEGPLADEARRRGLETNICEAPERLRVFEKGAIRGGARTLVSSGGEALRYSAKLHKLLIGWGCEVAVAAAVRPALLMSRTRSSRKIKVVLFAQNSIPFGTLAAASLPGVDVLAPIASGALTTFPDWSLRFAKTQMLLPSGRDLDEFACERAVDTTQQVRLISVASLTERKGFHDLIDAVRTLCAEKVDVTLAVIGGPSGKESEAYANRLKEAVAKEELPVVFHGWKDDVVPYLAEANVFVLASSHEGLPGVIIEAMASGLPVLTTDAGGCRDAVIDGETGYVVPVGDVDAIVDKVRSLTDSDTRKRMGAAGKDRANSQYTVDAFGDRFGQVLASTCKK